MGIKKIFFLGTRGRSRFVELLFFYFPVSDFYSTITAGPPCMPVTNNSHTRRSPYLPAIEIANGELKKYFFSALEVEVCGGGRQEKKYFLFPH